ncbi:MAG: hypothetical protein ABSG51_17555, partial [Terracidiphilus sp.]
MRPRAHARPAPASPVTTPEAILDASSAGSPILLDKNWRVGITANPAAATPEFDDSTWVLRDAQDSFADVPDEDHPAGQPDAAGNPGPKDHQGPPARHQRPFAWFRLHIKLAPNHGPVSLLIELPVSSNASINLGETGLAANVDVFANGKPIRPEGPHGDSPESYQPISRIYNLNLSPSETSLILVLRTIYIPAGIGSYTGFFANRTLRLGNPDDLSRSLQLWSIHTILERLPRLVYSILLTVLALFLLALYFTQKGHVEYLLLALHELVQAPIGFVDLAGSSAQIDQLWYGVVVIELVLISAYLYFEFLVAFLALRR